MTTRCYWDLETRSVANLRDVGSHTYAIDPTTEILCLAFAVDNDEPLLWLPGEPVPPVFATGLVDIELVAHNWTFENAILENILVPRHGFPPIALDVQHCSQRLAMANAYPAELGLLAEALDLPYQKDPAARRAMLAVSRPKAQRKRKGQSTTAAPVWNEDPALLGLVYERCRLDVITTRAVFNSPKLEPLTENERRYLLQDAAINGRGVRLDRPFAAAAMALAINERTATNFALQELTDGSITTTGQVARFLAAINARGHSMASMSKRSVAQVLANKPDDYVRRLLALRQQGARASVHKFKKMLAYASPLDDRLRGTLLLYGGATGRWSALGPQPQNLKRNESNLPLSVVDTVRSGDRIEIARYGAPLALLGDLSRAALCAAPGMELKSGDFSAIESIVLSWLAGEQWKLDAYRSFFDSDDMAREPYKIIARRMLHRADDAEIDSAERQLGKMGELASGFGGGVGAWRRIASGDTRSDDEIKAIIHQWRTAHPRVTKFWKDLGRGLRLAMRTGEPVLIAPPPQPPLVATFERGTLRLRLPSGRAIAYPGARLAPNRYDDYPPDIEFFDNAKGQWRPVRGWFGIFVENAVQAVARELLAAAIDRCEARGLAVVFHCHDEVTIETPVGALSDGAFRAILLEAPAWASGMPLGGKVHSGAHYLSPPEREAEPLPEADPDVETVEAAIDEYLDDARQDPGEIDDPALMEREDDRVFVATLPDEIAPLTEMVTLPLTLGNKVCCPFHDDPEPSCAIYADHFYCFGCGERGGRVDWLVRVEGLTEAEAIAQIKDWPATAQWTPQNGDDVADKLAFALSIWGAAGPLSGLAERYLDQTRAVDMMALPADIHQSLRFHPRCVFGAGAQHPCLIALMRDPLTDAPIGIQRTALEAHDGRVKKIDRRMLGQAGVVKLWPAGKTLVVGEGLETVLAAATRIPYRDAPLVPAWAALSTAGLKALPIIAGVKRLVLLVDNDENEEGQRAAAHAMIRWRAAGVEVETLIPPTPGTDFNDLVLREDAHAA
ncbi:MAG TPA: toprim domain-containing protein [Roseiarcus sp.]|jgi:DNA polymerase